MRYISFHVHSLKTAVGWLSMSGRLSLLSSLVSNDAHQKGQVTSICIVGELCVNLGLPLAREVANEMSRRD